MSKLVLFIATSSDGFIADVDGGVDWLPQPKNDAELEEVGYKDLMGRISTIVMGRKSYDQIVSFGDWAWPDKQTYVFSAEPIPSLATYITSTNEKPEGFCLNIADKEHRGDIWLLGGAKLAKSFNEKNLIDEIILTITQLELKKGIALDIDFGKYDLVSTKNLMDGMIQKKFYARHV